MKSAPRNRLAFERASAAREWIECVLESRRQSEPLLTPKDVQRILASGGRLVGLRTVQRYLREIRTRVAERGSPSAAENAVDRAEVQDETIAARRASPCA